MFAYKIIKRNDSVPEYRVLDNPMLDTSSFETMTVEVISPSELPENVRNTMIREYYRKIEFAEQAINFLENNN